MPRASHRRVNKNIARELNDHFAFLISSLRKPEDIEQFFQDFLTPEEKIMLTKRLMLHLMLENRYTMSQIGNVLTLSRETIRVHRNIWSRGGSTYRMIIGKIARREKLKKFWQMIERILKPVDLALRAKTDMKARAQFASGEWYDN